MTALGRPAPGGLPVGEPAPDIAAIAARRGDNLGDIFVLLVFPDYPQWRAVLDRLGVDVEEAVRLAARATENGTDFLSELLAAGEVEEEAVYREIARDLGIRHVDAIDPERLVIRPEDCALLLRHRGWHAPVKIAERDGRTALVVVPQRIGLGAMHRLLRRHRALLPSLRIASPTALRRALLSRGSAALATEARNGLYDRLPDYSARIVANAWQGLVLGITLSILTVTMTFAVTETLVGLHLAVSLFFLACIALRFAAMSAPKARPPKNLARTPPHLLPSYAVLVALHREASVVAQLVAALDRLAWPRSKLEIKLVCEADDRETLDALRRLWLPPHMEVVEVPPGLPRTKPKALSFALPLVRSDYLVLYDAEDRPHPLQLLEAWKAFEKGGRDLACLQAPLEITNPSDSLIAALFAFEYRALFRGLLPFLSSQRILLPLGGTSNHFRTAALREVGGWDPWNVTEDADLGIRLFRMGYRTGTIALPTFEDAPTSLSVWLPQRTRWFKGWLQTWLVHMRDPFVLAAQLGWRSFAIAQILMAGLVVSALVHPLLVIALATMAVQVATQGLTSGWKVALLGLDTVNVVCGYASFLLLGWHGLGKAERRSFWRVALWTPPYWMLLSAAAWRSVVHLWKRPHHWEKTPHRRTGQA